MTIGLSTLKRQGILNHPIRKRRIARLASALRLGDQQQLESQFPEVVANSAAGPQKVNILVDGVERSYFEQIFWAGLITGAYLPSTVFPTGVSTSDGLPIGLQAVSSEFCDYTCIDFARRVADELGGFAAPPGYED